MKYRIKIKRKKTVKIKPSGDHLGMCSVICQHMENICQHMHDSSLRRCHLNRELLRHRDRSNVYRTSYCQKLTLGKTLNENGEFEVEMETVETVEIISYGGFCMSDCPYITKATCGLWDARLITLCNDGYVRCYKCIAATSVGNDCECEVVE